MVRYAKSTSIPSAVSSIADPAIRAAAIEQLKARGDGEYCVFYNGVVYAFAPVENVKDGEISIKASGACYINSADKSELCIKSVMDRLFTVESIHKDIKWQVTSETRTVANYKCRKAISPETGYEVWFTTDVPIAAGPNGVVNLPGLVVKLISGTSVYTLSGVEECEDYSVVLPKGKTISTEEFSTIRQKRLREMGVRDSQGGVQVITL